MGGRGGGSVTLIYTHFMARTNAANQSLALELSFESGWRGQKPNLRN